MDNKKLANLSSGLLGAGCLLIIIPPLVLFVLAAVLMILGLFLDALSQIF